MANAKKKIDFTPILENLEELTETKKNIGIGLVDKAMFMESELQKLQETLSKKGWIEEYSNGATQKGLKTSSEANVYSQMIKNYNSTLKQLAELFPSNSAASINPVLDFIKR